MKVAVRNEIIDWIRQVKDEELLETLKLIKENSSDIDWYEQLSQKQKDSIQRGIIDHEKDNTLSSKEFWEKHG